MIKLCVVMLEVRFRLEASLDFIPVLRGGNEGCEAWPQLPDLLSQKDGVIRVEHAARQDFWLLIIMTAQEQTSQTRERQV